MKVQGITQLGWECVKHGVVQMEMPHRAEREVSDSNLRVYCPLCAYEALARKTSANVTLIDQRDAAQEALAKVTAQKDGAYSERNQLVALVASLALAMRLSVPVDTFNAWLGQHEDKPGEEWDADWRNIVFIQLPTGQLSWHLHDSEVHLFDFLKGRTGPGWDGHTTEEKYQRVRNYVVG